MLDRRQFSALLGAAMLTAHQARAQGSGYVLGTLYPMTGGLAELGGIYTQATALALEHVAADRKLARPLSLSAEDSQSTPQGGAVGMSKLVNVAKAQCVLLGVTGVSKAAEPIGTRAKVMMINGGGVGPDLAALSPYFWNVIPLAHQEVYTSIRWIRAQGVKRVALVYIDDPLGAAMLKTLGDQLPAVGAALVGAFSAPPSLQQFAAIAAKVRETNPDVIYVASYGTQQIQIFKQLRDAGLTQQFMTYSAGGTPSVASALEAEGLLFTSQVADWTAADPVTRRFVTDWRARFKGDPSTYAQNYYNATLLFASLLAEIEKANAAVDGDTLRATLLRSQFDLVGGAAKFASDGVISMPTQLNRIKAGRFEKVS